MTLATIDGTAAEVVTVCTYGFNVPCRRFLITANVTRDRRLPIVDEFVLRTLKICERIPVRRLGAYFGFNGSETEIVVSDLVGRGLIVIEGDDAVLHPSTREHFQGNEDGIPRIMEIDPWVDRVWFDLVSRNMVTPKERSRPMRNLIDIKPDDVARDLPTSFAQKAFELNFAEYLRRVRRISNPERFGLYSVSAVDPERFSSLGFRGYEDLTFDPQPRLRPRLLEVEVENLARYRPLTNALTDAYRLLRRPDSSGAGLTEFERLTGDRSVAGAHRDGKFFDVQSWLAENAVGANPDRQPLIGASYIRRNLDFFVQLLEKRSLPQLKKEAGRELNLMWFRPGGSAWGASPDLQDAVNGLRAVIRRSLSKSWRLRTTLVVPQVIRRETPRRFERIFDEGFIAPAGFLSPSIEVIIINGAGAVVLVWVSLTRSVSLFVGWAIADQQTVARIWQTLRWEPALQRTEQLWAKPRLEEEEELEDSMLQSTVEPEDDE